MDNGLSERLREAIRSRGGSVDTFAQAVGVSRATLFNLLKGATPRVDTLRKLKAAGVVIPRDLLSA